MSKQISFEDFERYMNKISALGDPLEKLAAVVDFEQFRPTLEKAAGRPRSTRGDRPTSSGPVVPCTLSKKTPTSNIPVTNCTP